MGNVPAAHGPGRGDLRFFERVRSELGPELEVLRPLGHSAAAEVVLAREPALSRLVAVKILSPTLAGDSGAIRRFQREARAAARIAHPNVVTVLRVGCLTDGLPFLVMRYVKGRSLGDLIEANGPPEIPAGCAILATVADAITAGHRRNVVHRDINPSNVLIEAATGRVVVVDFGLATILPSGNEAPDPITTVGHIVGHPRFMSPERLRGEPVDESSDVYNLALLAYEVLAGCAPFEASSRPEWIDAHLRSDPLPISAANPDIGRPLEDLLLSCLAKNPAHRPSAPDFEAVMRIHAGPKDSRVSSRDPVPVPLPTIPAHPRRPTPPRDLTGAIDPAIRLHMLGSLDLTDQNGRRLVSVVAHSRRAALVAFLASGIAQPMKSRDRIVSVFWPDTDKDKGRHALRQALYVLRGSLGSDVVVSNDEDEVGLSSDLLWCDARAFERAIAADRPDLAMELYRGTLLPGFYLTDVIEFEHWLENERLRLDRIATEAAWQLAADCEESGDGVAAVQWGRRAIELTPFDESGLRKLLELHDRIGDRAGALHAFDTFARRLREELEAEPTPQTIALVAQLRSS